MKQPGTVTGCTNPLHNHWADVAANFAKMNQCTFLDPPEAFEFTITRMDALALVDSIRSLRVPGYRLEGLMIQLSQRLHLTRDSAGK
jgi:hypothetical protein